VSGQNPGAWIEWDTDDGPLTMLCPGWSEDRTTLVEAIKQAGWYAMTWQAREAADAASLAWTWIGFDDDGRLWPCHLDGWCDELRIQLSEVSQVTIAEVPA
jgi:hypothetical protein